MASDAPRRIQPTESENKVTDTREKQDKSEKSIPSPPEKPLPDDCCGSGCVRCVWDVYYDELEAYQKLLQNNPPSESDALTKSILFFEGQRSWKLPHNQRVTWRRDSGLSDGAAMNVDLVGGYYDAGDNVKFGFPMAFTTTMLSWSVLEFGGLMKGELQNAKEAIRWATDYLLKATKYPDTIFVQVGDANKDHACWERPEDMDTPRSVFKIDKNSPGSDVAAETAAALASFSLVFRRSDPSYSALLPNRAIRVFQFADKYRGPYSAGMISKDVCPFYCSYSGYQVD